MENSTKSNAPWILGIIAFVLSIPNILCATLCAAATTVGAAIAASPDPFTTTTDADAQAATEAAAATATVASGLLWTVIVASILCFIFSFFGKSKNSHVTGILTIIGGAYIFIQALIGLGSWIWGTAAGILYLIGGIYSILNKKRLA